MHLCTWGCLLKVLFIKHKNKTSCNSSFNLSLWVIFSTFGWESHRCSATPVPRPFLGYQIILFLCCFLYTYKILKNVISFNIYDPWAQAHTYIHTHTHTLTISLNLLVSIALLSFTAKFCVFVFMLWLRQLIFLLLGINTLTNAVYVWRVYFDLWF